MNDWIYQNQLTKAASRRFEIHPSSRPTYCCGLELIGSRTRDGERIYTCLSRMPFVGRLGRGVQGPKLRSVLVGQPSVPWCHRAYSIDFFSGLQRCLKSQFPNTRPRFTSLEAASNAKRQAAYPQGVDDLYGVVWQRCKLAVFVAERFNSLRIISS